MQQKQVTVSLSIPLQSLIEMMRSLELWEKIKLRELLDRDIVITQQTEKSQDVPSSENPQNMDDAVKCFQRGWDDVINDRTRPITELWDGIDAD